MVKAILFIILSCFSSFIVYDNKNIKQEKYIKEEVLMKIEIPKINLNNNIYPKNSSKNNIDKNIIIMNESSMPDEESGVVIIGAHSGTGRYAYFKDLNKLEIDDEVIINYKNKKYTYKVIYYYLDKKDGSIDINRKNKRLYLYTCNPSDKNNFLVIVCEQKEK